MKMGAHTSHATVHSKSKAKYCLKCAGQLEDRIIEEKVRQACTTCDFVFYEDPKPVAGVLALKDGKLLLIQRGNEPKRGHRKKLRFERQRKRQTLMYNSTAY